MTSDNLTQILAQAQQGDTEALEHLIPLVYDELKTLAAAKLSREKPGQTIQATALVHEVYLRLLGVNSEQPWKSRRYFFAAAAESMRRILIDAARRKQSRRGGGEFKRIDTAHLDDLSPSRESPQDQLLELDAALERLEKQSPRKAELVKLRFFGGLTIEQAAAALEIAPSTAIADWAYARGWLKLEISKKS